MKKMISLLTSMMYDAERGQDHSVVYASRDEGERHGVLHSLDPQSPIRDPRSTGERILAVYAVVISDKLN